MSASRTRGSTRRSSPTTRAPERRFAFELGVGAEVDLARAQALALGVLWGMDSVLAEPVPGVVVDRTAGSVTVLSVSGWMDQRESDHPKVKSEAIRQVKQAFDAAGVPMPDPTYAVHRARVPQEPAAAKPGRIVPDATPADVTAATSTGADQAIKQKVAAERASSERDLLTPEAPRE